MQIRRQMTGIYYPCSTFTSQSAHFCDIYIFQLQIWANPFYRRRSMIPDFGIILWLVKCLHVDRFAVLLTVSCSFNITRVQFGKRFFKTRISSTQYKFLCETFRLSHGSKKSKKYACDKRKRSIQNMELFLHSPAAVTKCGHIYKTIDL